MSSPTNNNNNNNKKSVAATTVPVSILKNPSSGPSLTSKNARIALSEDEDDDIGNLQKYISDGDDDEPGTEPMSAEALELLSSEKVLKAGYLLKKGEKRRTWKKRWFVLRSTKLAMYKDKKEYKLLRIIDLHEIHKVVQVTSKNKYKYVFAFVTPKRVYYVQANDQQDMDDWFKVLNQAKEEQRLCDVADDEDDTNSISRDQEFAKDLITSYKSNHIANQQQQRRRSSATNDHQAIMTINTSTVPPMDIPTKKQNASSPNHSSSAGTPLGEYALGHTYPLSPVSDHTTQMCTVDGLASSEDDEEYSVNKANVQLEESRNRVLIEGYLLKLGRNKGWRKRWFVLRTDSLAYYEDDKEYSPHRIIPLVHIMDSLEIDPVSKSKQFCFKIIIPKRSYVLCAPTENDMDSWLNALVVAIRRAKKEEEADDSSNNNSNSNVNGNSSNSNISPNNKIISSSTPTTPQPQHHHHHHQYHHNSPGRQLSSILENATISNSNYPLQKSQSVSSSESFENTSHISGVSGAGGVGGAGGALGGAPTSNTNILQLHSRASERLGRAK